MTTEPSPFIDGRQFVWDSTSLGWFKSCPRKYYYSMIEGWQLRGTSQSVNIVFGLHYHRALETYDKRLAYGDDRDTALLEVIRQTMIETYTWTSDDTAKNRATLIRSIVWYCDQFRDDPAVTMILANGKPAVELSFKLDIGDGLILSGHLDRVVSYLGDYYVMDRKTTKSTISQHYFDKYKPDNQMTLYTIAGQMILNSPVKGVILDVAQCAVGFNAYGRGFTYRTGEQLDDWLTDLRYWSARAWDLANKPINAYPMNDTACDKFGGCAFRKVCGASPSVRSTILNSDYEKRKWNPLIPRT